MDTTLIVRLVIGISFILFGLGVYAYDKLHDMKYSEFRYSPLSWIFCVGAGVFSAAFTVKMGVIFAVVAIVLWIGEKIILSKIIENNRYKKTV